MKSGSLDVLYKHFLTTGGRQILVVFLNLISTIIFTRLLGAEGSGTVATYSVAVSFIAMISTLGFSSGLVYFASQGELEKESIKQANQLFSLLILPAILVAVIIAIFAAKNKMSVALIFVLAVQIYTLFAKMGYVALFLGFREYNRYNITILAGGVGKVVIAVIALLTQTSLSIEVGLLLLISDELICYIVALVYYLPKKFESLDRSWGLIKKFVAYGWKVNISNIITSFVYRADIYIVEMFAGLGAVGVYNFAVQIAEKAWIPSQAISTIVFPEFAASKKVEERSQILRRVVSLTGWSTLVLALGAPLALFVLVHFVGKGFSESIAVSFYLVPGIVAMGVGRIYWNFIAARGLPGLNIKIVSVSFVVNIIADIIFVPAWGVIGAAIGSSIAYLVHLFLSFIFARRLMIKDFNAKKSEAANIQGSEL